MNEENNKNKYITEEYLDKRMGEQKKYLDERMGEQKKYLDERMGEQKKYLDERMGEQTQVLLSSLDSILTKRLIEVKEDLRIDINNNQTIIDGYVKAQEDFKQEFTVMKEEFKQMKQVIKEKLGVEIRAI